ncbi:MAG: LptF/LptG family permease [Pirellulales bacterium]|nr:LptF/LptG family permease [Pirellulales bacterium]
MTVLQRYILGELLRVLALTGTSLTGFMLLIGVSAELLRQGLGPAHVVRIIPYVLPNALVFSLPGALLLSVTVLYGRMSAANEILVAKSFGIHPARLFVPTLVISFLLSLATVWLYDLAVSWGFRGVQQVVLMSTDQVVYGVLKTRKTFQAGGLSIVVRDVVDRTLVSPVLSFSGKGDEPGVTIRAESGELRAEGTVLRLKFRHATVEIASQARGHFQEIEREVPLNELVGKHEALSSPGHLALREIPDELERTREELALVHQKRAAATAFGLLSGNLGYRDTGIPLPGAEIKYIQERIDRLRTEGPRRWATGFSCLCFALVGATMAVWRKHAEIVNIFFSCYAPILVVYYPLFISALEMSKSGQMPPLVVWTGNLVLAVWGLLLLQRIVRY